MISGGRMQLIKTPNNKLLQVTRKELKYYLDNSTEAFLNGKTRMLFPVGDSEITEVMVLLDV